MTSSVGRSSSISGIFKGYRNMTSSERTARSNNPSGSKSKIKGFANRFFNVIKSTTIRHVAGIVTSPMLSPYVYFKKGFFKTQTAKANALVNIGFLLIIPLIMAVFFNPLFIPLTILLCICGILCATVGMGMFRYDAKVIKETSDNVYKIENKIKNILNNIARNLFIFKKTQKRNS